MLYIRAGEQRIRAAVTLPGSKSISNRMLLLKSVLAEDTEIQRLSVSEDTSILAQALDVISTSDSATIDIGQAGTDMRFLTAYLAGRPGTWLLTGSERMKQRPLGPLVDALRELGAKITYVDAEGFPPLRIEGSQLKGGEISINGQVSSQFISALLLISPLLDDGTLTIHLEGETVSRPYITMTLQLMRLFGVASNDESNAITIKKRRRKMVKIFEVEPDWSSASYYYSLCALATDASIELKHLQRKSLQADSVAAQLYEKLGVHSTFRADSVLLTRQEPQTDSFEYDFTNCPDLAQTVAVTCFGLGIPARLHGLRTLRIKETDRVEALSRELSKLGASVHTEATSLFIEGSPGPPDALHTISTYDDHRMAMSFAPLATRYTGLLIERGEVVRKSYPDFWQDLQALGFTVILQP